MVSNFPFWKLIYSCPTGHKVLLSWKTLMNVFLNWAFCVISVKLASPDEVACDRNADVYEGISSPVQCNEAATITGMLLHDHWLADSPSFAWWTQIGIRAIYVFLFVGCIFLNPASSVPLFLSMYWLVFWYSFPNCIYGCLAVCLSPLPVCVFFYDSVCFGSPLLVNTLWVVESEFRWAT